MRLGVMQPYFVPYIGYFQLIGSVDTLVLYDNIEFTKKGWITRNRILSDKGTTMLSLALKNDSDYLHISDRSLAPTFNRQRLLNQIAACYRRAPQFEDGYALAERIVTCQESNLFSYLRNGILEVTRFLGISTKVVASSTVQIDHELRGQDKVIALSAALGASTYINAPGGVDLYSSPSFAEVGVDLRFIKPAPRIYHQFGSDFVPSLSVIDAVMFNTREQLKSIISSDYALT